MLHYLRLDLRMSITQSHTHTMQQIRTHAQGSDPDTLKLKSYSLVEGNRSIGVVSRKVLAVYVQRKNKVSMTRRCARMPTLTLICQYLISTLPCQNGFTNCLSSTLFNTACHGIKVVPSLLSFPIFKLHVTFYIFLVFCLSVTCTLLLFFFFRLDMINLPRAWAEISGLTSTLT